MSRIVLEVLVGVAISVSVFRQLSTGTEQGKAWWTLFAISTAIGFVMVAWWRFKGWLRKKLFPKDKG